MERKESSNLLTMLPVNDSDFSGLSPTDLYLLILCFQSREITPLSSRESYFRSEVLQYWSKLLLRTPVA